MKHTPGPWHHFKSEYTGEFCIGSQTLPILARTHNYPEQSEANAQLIAAAPELLEACKALQMEAAARGCGLRIADEAILKAEGQANG